MKRTRKIALLVMLILALCIPTLGTSAAKSCSHSWNSWKTTQSATIKAKGTSTRTCKKCGLKQKKSIAKLNPYVKLSKKEISLIEKNTYKLKINYAKGDSVRKWTSSNTKVAKVSTTGNVTAVKKGTATITVTMKSGKKATCKVTVKAKSSSSSKKVSSSQSGSSGIVYWTPSGKVYHTSRNCSTLSRSKTIYKGSIAQSHKPRACKVCH